ncbi:hypothetical protein ACTRXD_00350 [Nitrospira sp. T9]|uniref:hypothetical protein n=1 Tax=unclassified Nitrospira TaxID=2652172 RepID=UPI003F9EB816
MRSRDDSKNLIRLQFDVPPEKIKELENFVELTQVGTKKALFNTAFSLLAWAIRECQAGRSIAAVDEDTKTYRELVIPALENVKTHNIKAHKEQKEVFAS